MTTLFLCGSIKPAPGTDVRSASRELLKLVMSGYTKHRADGQWFDLRDRPLPFYDGRFHGEYQDPALNELVEAVGTNQRIVLSVPAYWGAAAGGIKNALDLLGGPAYDNPSGRTPLQGKKAILLVVGATERDGWLAAVQMRTTLLAMGASVSEREIIVGNLRQSSAAQRKELALQLFALGESLATDAGEPMVGTEG